MPYLIWLFVISCFLLRLAYSIPCYTETKSSKAMYRRHGPIVVDQNQCALACSCASGVNQAFDNCTVFNPPLPSVDCQAYSYNFSTRHCALLGGERPNVCAEPVTIYDMGKCASYPKCGSTTLDQTVFCDSEGFKCPAGYLPYFSFGGLWGEGYTRAWIGGQLIQLNDAKLIVSFVSSAWEYKRPFVQNITCHPAPSHTYAACNLTGKAPVLTDALILKDTFGCLPGKKFDFAFVIGEFNGSVYTPPVCTPEGWRVRAGGALINKIIDVRCKKIV